MYSMNNTFTNVFPSDKMLKTLLTPLGESLNSANTAQNYLLSLSEYVNDFMLPCLTAAKYFNKVEQTNIFNSNPFANMMSMLEFIEFNFDLSEKGCSGTFKATKDFADKEFSDEATALFNTFSLNGDENLLTLIQKRARAINIITHDYPQAIQEIEPEFGFHFENGINEKIMETERFSLYRITSTDPAVTERKSAKPVLIIPPYVLGANILAFLPAENQSYAHSFANQGIPTYIRIIKDIDIHEAVQTMNGEDDATDTKRFCEKIKSIHGKKITLNGYCQGGYSALCNVLSGELDGLVDALITCVSPIDGSQSDGLSAFLKRLPGRYNDLAFGTKTLPNGNQVADGQLMSWIYKLKSIGSSSPVVSFLRDLAMLTPKNNEKPRFNKTGIALNYWLKNELTDIPLGITQMSFASFNSPLSSDGTLPVKLFGKELNLKRIKEKNIKWLICYGKNDDLVEIPAALAPTKFIDVETTPFPKGHVAIATSWSKPDSAYALHKRYDHHRGPVRFHLDIDKPALRLAG